MSEQIIEPTEDTTTEEVVKTDKVYTDKEVQKIIKERLGREKEATLKLSESWEQEKATYQSTLQSYEGILNNIITERVSDLPEEYKILFDKLSLVEKWEFISKQEKTSTKKIPSTPFPLSSEGKIPVASEETKKIKIF